MGAYKYNNTVTFIEKIEEVPEEKYFKAAPPNGMKELVDEIPNDLTQFKANVAIAKANTKKTLPKAALLVSSTIVTETTTNEDAYE